MGKNSKRRNRDKRKHFKKVFPVKQKVHREKPISLGDLKQRSADEFHINNHRSDKVLTALSENKVEQIDVPREQDERRRLAKSSDDNDLSIPEKVNVNLPERSPVETQPVNFDCISTTDANETLNGMMKRKRKRIQFVYPLENSEQGMHARLFTFTKSVLNTDDTKQNDSEKTNNSHGSEEIAEKFINDSIDDILFPNRKRGKDRSIEECGMGSKKEVSTDSPSSHTLTCASFFQSKDIEKDEKQMIAIPPHLNNLSSSSDNANDLSLASAKSCTNQKAHLEVDVTVNCSKGKNLTDQRKNQTDENSSTDRRVRTASIEVEVSYGMTSVQDAVRDKKGCRPRSNSTDGELNLPQTGLCDERAVLASHKWKNNSNGGWKLTDNNKSCAPKGLLNLGNTCFLNATLQCLAFLPTFCQCISSLCPKSIALNGSISKGQKLTNIIRTLLRQIHCLDEGKFENSNQRPIKPSALVNQLPSLGSKKGRFRLGRQEDAHEFLVHLLDTIHEGELQRAGIDQRKSGWRDRLPIPRLDETTLMHRVFGGYLRSQVRCTQCGYKSNTYDPFLDISLEVSKASSNSVAAAIMDFTRKETLDVRNQWKCSGCHKRVCATKQLTIFRPPLTLCIQLKRFSYDCAFSRFSYGGGGAKIRKPIQYPESLSLPLSDKRKCEYDLTGVIIHIGGSASSGHYTAYIRKPGSGGTSQWYHMDDSSSSPVSLKTVLREPDAYILFYCRREVQVEYPKPPARSNMSAEEAQEVGRWRALAKASGTVTTSALKSENSSTQEQLLTKDSSVSLSEDTKCSLHRQSRLAKNAEALLDKPDSSETTIFQGSPSSQKLPEDTAVSYKSDCAPISDAVPVFNIQNNCKVHKGSNATPSLGRTIPGKLIFDRGSQVGRVEVVAGKKRNRMKLKDGISTNNLFGNGIVGHWDDESPNDKQDSVPLSTSVEGQRKSALSRLVEQERERKKNMRLEKWDAMLDEGKKKKVKNKQTGNQYRAHGQNPFQRQVDEKSKYKANQKPWSRNLGNNNKRPRNK